MHQFGPFLNNPTLHTLSYHCAPCSLKHPSLLQGFPYLTPISGDSWVSPVVSISLVNRAGTCSLSTPKGWTFFGLNPYSFMIIKLSHLSRLSELVNYGDVGMSVVGTSMSEEADEKNRTRARSWEEGWWGDVEE